METDLPTDTLPVDLVGGPFAVIESDPDVFTTLLRTLGVRGLAVTEVFDINDPFAGNSLSPRGLIFCYPCEDDEEDTEASQDDAFEESEMDPDAEGIWFAHQLCNDACASQAILNIVLNLEPVRLADELDEFKRDTEKMSPVMKGLALTNCAFIREAHNHLARPADIRAALHAATTSTLEYVKKSKKKNARDGTPPPTKRRKTNTGSPKKKEPVKSESSAETLDSYHFIGYVPAHGKVWELDGLRHTGPLEVGELPDAPLDNGASASMHRWMDIVRPALRRRMQRLQENDHIRYNLLAIVEDQYEKASDGLEMLKRERVQLERRLDEEYADGWAEKVDASLLAESGKAFATSVHPTGTPGPTYATDFASRKLTMEMAILDMPARKLPGAWETCVRNAQSARRAVEDEIRASERANADHIRRTFDYEPFIQTFITLMHSEGLLDPIISKKGTGSGVTMNDENGSASKKSKKKSKR